MQAMNRTHKIIAIVVIATLSIIALAFGIAKILKRRALLEYHNEIVNSLSAEIDVYKNLGFNERDAVVEITKARMTRAMEELSSVKKNSPQRKNKENSARVVKLEKLLRLNKEMAVGYRNEIIEYKKLGFSDADQPIRSAKLNLAELVTEIAHLERTMESIDVQFKEQIRKKRLIS